MGRALYIIFYQTRGVLLDDNEIYNSLYSVTTSKTGAVQIAIKLWNRKIKCYRKLVSDWEDITTFVAVGVCVSKEGRNLTDLDRLKTILKIKNTRCGHGRYWEYKYRSRCPAVSRPDELKGDED